MTKRRIIRYKRSIDKEIYPVIRKLNNRGIPTEWSCSGHGKDIAHITFAWKLTSEQKDAVEGILRESGFGDHGFDWSFQRVPLLPWVKGGTRTIVEFWIVEPIAEQVLEIERRRRNW